MGFRECLLERVLQYDKRRLNTTISLHSGIKPRRTALLRPLAERLFEPIWALQNSLLGPQATQDSLDHWASEKSSSRKLGCRRAGFSETHGMKQGCEPPLPQPVSHHLLRA